MNDKFSAVDVSKLSQATSEPRPEVCLGRSLGDIRLPPRWCPAYRQHEPGPGSRTERVKACPDTVRRVIAGEKENSKRQNPQGAEYRSVDTLADVPVVAVIRLRIAVGRGAKGWGRPGERMWSTEREGTA